jgi:hypothetical protein
MDVGAELKGKVGPFPLYVWLLIMTGGALAAYMFLKKKNSGQQMTGTPGTPCTQSDGSAGTWDSTGTVCQATTVSTVNAPTSQGRQWRSQSTAATATDTGTSSTGTTTTTPPPGGTVSSGGTGTGNPNSGNWSFPPPGGLKVTGAGKHSTQIKLSWSPVKGPAGQTPATYTVRIFRGGQQIRENTVAGTSYTENGLAKGTTGLTINVWANGGPLAPTHATATT